MDGVLADVYAHFICLERELYGLNINLADLNGIPESEATPHYHRLVHSEGFFRNVPPIGGSVEAVRMLNEQHRVFIVSAATEFPRSLSEKHHWLNEHFPFISWQQMIFCGDKSVVKGDVMIDDYFKNLDFFAGRQKILFTQPHNAQMDNKDCIRVNGWDEILKLLATR